MTTLNNTPARPKTASLRLDIKISTATSQIYRAEASRFLRRSRLARSKGKTAVADKLLNRMFEMRWMADDANNQRHRLSALAICRGKQIPCNPKLLTVAGLTPYLVQTGMTEEAAKTAATDALKGIPLAVAA